MACPYFEPAHPRAHSTGPQSAMLPLGDSWAGVCRARAGEAWEPDEGTLDPLCNLGYARGSCPRFPDGGGPDAVRFSVSHDGGGSVGLYFAMERDHHPFAHGPLEYSRAGGRFTAPIESELLARQAQAYVDSYLRRKEEASGRA